VKKRGRNKGGEKGKGEGEWLRMGKGGRVRDGERRWED
jgi:hypothetical protein